MPRPVVFAKPIGCSREDREPRERFGQMREHVMEALRFPHHARSTHGWRCVAGVAGVAVRCV
ncbi:hypothetical protein DID98_33920 [Burkholderia sp. Bp8984]|nr:hypothetical protein DID98_33920 [Burkholderia sp. Bp8984]